MNKYGMRAREHWSRYAPTRLAALPNPEAFFADLGSQAEAEVSDLAAILAGTDPMGETYLQKVARLATARRTAEEVVMAQLVWVADPELPLDQAREEWEQTSPSWEGLISWAERMQDSPDSMPSTEELEEKATAWAVTPEFLEQLIASEPPRAFMNRNQAILNEATTIRFMRELR